MLLDSVLFFALTATVTTVAVIVLRLVRARVWLGLPLTVLTLVAGGAATLLMTQDQVAVAELVLLSLVAGGATWLVLREWSFIAAQVFALLCLAGLAYLVYASYLTVFLLLNYSPIWFVSSLVLLVLETAAMVLAITYAFEMLDVLSRREPPFEIPPLQRAPLEGGHPGPDVQRADRGGAADPRGAGCAGLPQLHRPGGR